MWVNKTLRWVALGVVMAAPVWAAHDIIISSFPSPTNYPTGLAYGDDVLYLADYGYKWIYLLTGDTGSIISSYAFTRPGSLYGLAYDAGYLWVVTRTTAGSRLYRVVPSSGSLVASFELTQPKSPDGLACDGDYLYIANNDVTLTRVFKIVKTTGSLQASYNVYTKYPGGLELTTHGATMTPVLLSLGNIDGWCWIYGVNGTWYSGEQFLIDVPCPVAKFNGDLAVKDTDHFYFASDHFNFIYYEKIIWTENEYPAVVPASLGRVKAIYR